MLVKPPHAIAACTRTPQFQYITPRRVVAVECPCVNLPLGLCKRATRELSAGLKLLAGPPDAGFIPRAAIFEFAHNISKSSLYYNGRNDCHAACAKPHITARNRKIRKKSQIDISINDAPSRATALSRTGQRETPRRPVPNIESHMVHAAALPTAARRGRPHLLRGAHLQTTGSRTWTYCHGAAGGGIDSGGESCPFSAPSP